MKMIAFRIKPGQDLKIEIEKIVKELGIRAGFIGTCVGSLNAVTIRMAGAEPQKQDVRAIKGNFEIISLVGTVSVGGVHLHLSVSDEEGEVIGGHLKEGSKVATTAEVVIGYDENILFERTLDEETGFEELSVEVKS